MLSDGEDGGCLSLQSLHQVGLFQMSFNLNSQVHSTITQHKYDF